MILTRPLHPNLSLHETPGTFSALMDLYECNYINVRRLIPILPQAPTRRISQIPGGLDLHVHITERFRYTSELLLTYRFDQNGQNLVEPDLRIRIYHDARLAEVMTAHLRHQTAFNADLASGCPNGTELYARWRVNRFLYKWLNYCLRQGHRFAELSSAPPEI